MKTPIITTESGTVYPNFENEAFYFFKHLTKQVAEAYCQQLLEAGYKAEIDKGFPVDSYYVRIRK